MNNMLFNKIKYKLKDIIDNYEIIDKESITNLLFEYLAKCDNNSDKLAVLLSFYDSINGNYLNEFIKVGITDFFDTEEKLSFNFSLIDNNDMLVNAILNLCENDIIKLIYDYGIKNKLFKGDLMILKKIENACVIKGILKSYETSLILNSVLISKIITSKRISISNNELFFLLKNINNKNYIGNLKIDYDDYKSDIFIYNINSHDKIVNCDLNDYKRILDNLQKKQKINNMIQDVNYEDIKNILISANNV